MLANLNDVLIPARDNGYAVGLFNTVDTAMLKGAIAAAEELRSPIIVGTAEVLLPNADFDLIAPAIINMARTATVPVVVHFDHGLTLENCIKALRAGFTSLMYDGSALNLHENYKTTRQIVKIAHSMGVTVEGEIGHVGEAVNSDGSKSDMYTTVREAVDFLESTNVDALAIAIGTAHGAYKEKPKLDINRLADIHKAIPTPLVLHGGSGLSDDDFKNTIKNGIAKVNIFTDLLVAADTATQDCYNKGLSGLDVMDARRDAVKEAVKKKIMLFGSNGKA